MSDPATSRWDKNVFFSVNRQAVACWRPMPSNLNSNYTKLGTLSYNQDKPTCLATETSKKIEVLSITLKFRILPLSE